MRTMTIEGFMNLFLNVARISKNSYCLIIVSYCKKLLSWIFTYSINISIINSLKNSFNLKTKFPTHCSPSLICTGWGRYISSIVTKKSILVCLIIYSNLVRIPAPIYMKYSWRSLIKLFSTNKLFIFNI